MRIIKTAKYEYEDVAKRELEGKCSTGPVKRILEEEGEAAAEAYLAEQGVSYGDARACIRALKA